MDFMIIEYLRRLAQYNRWMNEKLYAICETMTDEERKRDRGAPFRSIHGVLNHLLLADRVWLGRYSGNPFPATALDQELYSSFDELKRERAITDAAIEAWLETFDEEKLAGNLTFTGMSNPVERTVPNWTVVQHVFNHQTHHRGQLTALIEQAGYDCGVTDIMMLPIDLK
jgi:uncharacterized damage-inducible protein DinB